MDGSLITWKTHKRKKEKKIRSRIAIVMLYSVFFFLPIPTIDTQTHRQKYIPYPQISSRLGYVYEHIYTWIAEKKRERKD